MKSILVHSTAVAVSMILGGLPAKADETAQATVDTVMQAVMAEHDIPGASVAVLHDGKRHIFHYGVASRDTRKPVDDRTIFEIGSLSKTFTGTLLARLDAEKSIDLSAAAQSILPELEGSPVGKASLLQLHTYVAGGLPLQFPNGVNEKNFTEYYRDFKPAQAIGTSRLYSNASIGLSGYLAAKQAGGSYASLLAEKVIEPLKLSDTFLDVPAARQADYAQGYTRDNAPVRVNPGLFDEEAYGIKTTASDFLSFVEASMKPPAGGDTLAEAFATTRAGVYRVNRMHQGMGWELYASPARLADLQQGVDPAFVLEPNPIEPADKPVTGAVVGTVSKTGSTGGFGAYALFQPDRGTAVVILANRFWPNTARIEAAHAILGKIDAGFFTE